MPPWASYNTPLIELIQYERRIGKKVYYNLQNTNSLKVMNRPCNKDWVFFFSALIKELLVWMLSE